VIQPRKKPLFWSLRVQLSEGRVGAAEMARRCWSGRGRRAEQMYGGFPRNVGDPGVNAPHDTDCITGADPPMVCAQALLKLARWCQQRSQSASGGEPCPTSGKTEFPPAHSGGGNVCGAGATLDDVVADHASGHPSDTESRRRSTTTNANDRPGGVG
jgi:hypothetical protein